MDLAEPIDSVIPSVHGRVLAVLARAHSPMGSRQITELTNGPSRRRVDAVLAVLAEAGLADRQVYPSIHLYQLNRRHLAAAAITSLASLREELLRRLTAAVTGWGKQPEATWIFGSAARGDGNPTSDVDLCVLRPAHVHEDDPVWLAQGASLSADVFDWTGNDCRVVEFSMAEFAGMVDRRERLVTELERDAIRIQGRLISDLARRRSAVDSPGQAGA